MSFKPDEQTESVLHITPDEVMKAYETTRLVPAFQVYAMRAATNGPWCGCPLTALYLAVTPADQRRPMSCQVNSDNEFANTVEDWADEKYGSRYRVGFVEGVDGYLRGVDEEGYVVYHTPRYQQGYEDGQAVRTRLLLAAQTSLS